jgi:hypothetical protein
MTLTSLVACAFVLIRRHMRTAGTIGDIRIFQDSTAVLTTATEKRLFTTLADRHWVSGWFCSVAVNPARGGRKRFLIICASDNDPDEYRRLLRFLRMRTLPSEAQRLIW